MERRKEGWREGRRDGEKERGKERRMKGGKELGEKFETPS
jgi:hypothetical protein